jgi:putative sigma-54 modulation protein
VDIIVTAKCDVPARVREEALRKVEHATRFFDRLATVEVVFRSESNPRIAEPASVELTTHARGQYLRAQGWARDHRGALDVAVNRFERQLARYKARLRGRRRGTRAAVPAAAAMPALAAADGGGSGTAEGADAWPVPNIVRRKQFELAPMLPDEAAVQLELLGHDFFVFTNAATGGCNVVYRRRDGDLGLIETTPATGAV